MYTRKIGGASNEAKTSSLLKGRLSRKGVIPKTPFQLAQEKNALIRTGNTSGTDPAVHHFISENQQKPTGTNPGTESGVQNFLFKRPQNETIYPSSNTNSRSLFQKIFKNKTKTKKNSNPPLINYSSKPVAAYTKPVVKPPESATSKPTSFMSSLFKPKSSANPAPASSPLAPAPASSPEAPPPEAPPPVTPPPPLAPPEPEPQNTEKDEQIKFTSLKCKDIIDAINALNIQKNATTVQREIDEIDKKIRELFSPLAKYLIVLATLMNK
jgi:hypothetical protein